MKSLEDNFASPIVLREYRDNYVCVLCFYVDQPLSMLEKCIKI